MHFDVAIEKVLHHEGGYVDDPADPGGETNFGISKRSYPDVDIKNLTREDAIGIYRTWWDKYGYGRFVNLDVAAKVFDLSVNVGPWQAHTMLQRALYAAGQTHVDVDGIIGPQTTEATNAANADMLLGALRAEAAGYYRRLIERRPALVRFERGWMTRAYS